MAKRKTRKCVECGKVCETSTMFVYEYFSKKRNGEIVLNEKYYCNEECSKAKEKRKKLIEDTNNLIELILEMPIRMNMYFNKLYSPIVQHYGYQTIYDMLNGEYGNLVDALNKDFVTINVKIKYFMAIVQNKIEDYKVMEEESKEEKISTLEIVDLPKVEYKPKEKKSIFDI